MSDASSWTSGLWSQPGTSNWPAYEQYNGESASTSDYQSTSQETRNGLQAQESDAISALASLAQHPQGHAQSDVSGETTSTATTASFSGLYHWPQATVANGSSGGYGSGQLPFAELLPDVMKSIDQKLVEHQKRLSAGWSEALGRGAYASQSAAAPVYGGYYASAFGGWPTAGQSSAFGYGSVSSNWRRWLTPADQLAYPPLCLGNGLPKVAEWQLSTLLSRHIGSSLLPTTTANEPAHDSYPPPSKVSRISTAKGESGTSSTVASKTRPLPKSESSSSSLERLLVVRDVEKVFGHRIRREANAEADRGLQRYFGRPIRKFSDKGFEVRPFSDRILLHDGSYESPDSLKHRLENNIGQKTDQCKCLGSEVSEELEGPYYTHLGAAPTLPALRRLMEEKLGERGDALRIEKVVYTGKEGRTQDGCPVAKWIIRRSSYREKVLCIARERPGHRCATAVLAVLVVLWDGIERRDADTLYDVLIKALPTGGMPTNRRCALNDQRTCACQGTNDATGGASFSFGCSWSMYYNTCKFARSRNPKRFKLLEPTEEPAVEEKLQALADAVAEQYRRVAPAAYRNQTYLSYRAPECRLGTTPGGPFTGVTACVDFCAHSHRDVHNMSNGCTVVVSMTKHRGLGKTEDEQLHVLPLYIPAKSDEGGSEENQMRKVETGAIETLEKYPMLLRYRREPLPNCKERNKRQPCPPQHRPSPTFMSQFKVEQHFAGGYYPAPFHGYQTVYPGYGYTGYAPAAFGYPTSHPGQLMGQWGGAGYPAPDAFAQWPTRQAADLASFDLRGLKRPASLENGEDEIVPDGFYTSFSENEHAFADPQIGGVAVAVGHGSILFENGEDEIVPNGFYTSFSENEHAFADPQIGGVAVAVGHGLENGEDEIVPDGFYTFSDNEHAFADPQIGGVAVAVGHGSILFEVAKKELHSTTALKRPDRRDPKRISLVFYQHKNLCFVNHGYDEWDRRLAAKKQGKPDLVSTTRAAAAKVRFDLKLPSSVKSLPLEPNMLLAPTNRALSVLRCSARSVWSKPECTIVDSKGLSAAARKKEEEDKAAAATTTAS